MVNNKAKTEKVFFDAALPVWAEGKLDEMNFFLRFTTCISEPMAELKIAACNIFRVFINGKFAFSGPARAAHGYYRAESRYLDTYLKTGKNKVVIEVGAYRVNSYQYLDEPGFLQCEIISGEQILAATGKDGFTVTTMPEKKQKVQRYSFQRTFCEEYDFSRKGEVVKTCVLPKRKLLKKRVSNCLYEKRYFKEVYTVGKVLNGIHRESYTMDRYVTDISPSYKGFHFEQLEDYVTQEVEEMDFIPEVNESNINRDLLESNRYVIYDAKINTTGYICACIEAFERITVYFIFDEILSGDDIDFTRLTSANVVKYDLQPGKYRLQTFEPYTMRYLKIVVLGGKCRVDNLHIIQIRNALNTRKIYSVDPELNSICDAAVETFCQNAVDIFMDCPSRERAGWLCDSFFMGRTEYALTGDTKVETSFIENYLLPEHFAHIPDGMVPMCYPADHPDGVFIPNWAMWLVLELEEYLDRSGTQVLKQKMEYRIKGLLKYFENFENEDGLLENLEGWIFVEWSKCNELTEGVNYPTNMLYSAMLDAAGRILEHHELCEKAAHIRAVIRQQALGTLFFIEHGVRKEGKIVPENEITETCQYYAFFFGIADPNIDKKLWETLLNKFGPKRKEKNNYKKVWFSNAFIGNYLRLSLLKKYGYIEKMKSEIKDYFSYMEQKTHTLWEHDSVKASCNHGFASYVVCLLEE